MAALRQYQRDFIALCLEHRVLSFGQFTLKSGRVSPYFFNTGLFNTGAALHRLAAAYAAALLDAAVPHNLLFGPAYKGIPLVAALAVALSSIHDKDVPFAFNRKEAKDHGEGGMLVGHPISANTNALIVDDVITAGTAIRETVTLLKKHNAAIAGVLIALDRQEVIGSSAPHDADVYSSTARQSAVQSVAKELGVPVISIVKLDDIIQYLIEQGEDGEFAKHIDAVQAYRDKYGA